jgi:hypothetical protein
MGFEPIGEGVNLSPAKKKPKSNPLRLVTDSNAMSYIITIYRASLFFYLFRIASRSFRGNDDAVDISRPMHVSVLLLQSDPGIRKNWKRNIGLFPHCRTFWLLNPVYRMRSWSFWHGHLRASSSSQSNIYRTLYKPRSEIKTCVSPFHNCTCRKNQH